MRLHENNNEEDELQRLRARRQGTDRSRRPVSPSLGFSTITFGSNKISLLL